MIILLVVSLGRSELVAQGNLVLRQRVSGGVKHNFLTYIQRYTAPNEHFEYGYPHSNVFYTSKTVYLQQNDVKSLRWSITSDAAFDVGFLMVYHRIYCPKF